MLTGSSCTEQSRLVCKWGCFWCKRWEPKCTEGWIPERAEMDSQCLGFKLCSSSGPAGWEQLSRFRNLDDTIGRGIENRDWLGELLWLVPCHTRAQEPFSFMGGSLLRKACSSQNWNMHHGADRSLELQVLFLQFSHEILYNKSNIFMCTGQPFAVTSDMRQMFSSIVFISPKGPLAWASLLTNQMQQKQLTVQDQWWW